MSNDHQSMIGGQTFPYLLTQSPSIELVVIKAKVMIEFELRKTCKAPPARAKTEKIMREKTKHYHLIISEQSFSGLCHLFKTDNDYMEITILLSFFLSGI